MKAIFLCEQDVRYLMDMETSINVVEEAFRQLATESTVNRPRVRVGSKGILLHTMSASAEYLGLVGWKAYTTTKSGARFHVAVYDNQSGRMVAMIEANYLGQLRTGAASGVATEFMARPDASSVGVFGAGLQARTQLKAVCTVRKIKRVEVYCRDDDQRAAFADEMSEYCATQVEPVSIPDRVAAEKDIVITATTSKSPVFAGGALDEGTHLNVIGSNFIGKREVDATTIRRSNHVICDSIEQCRLESGEFADAVKSGAREWHEIHELSDVIAGRETGRARAEDITMFKSVGLAIQDVAMAAKIVEKAKEEGIGHPLPM